MTKFCSLCHEPCPNQLNEKEKEIYTHGWDCEFWSGDKGCLIEATLLGLSNLMSKVVAYLELVDMYRRTGGTHG